MNLPAESFRVEQMALYVEFLIGMQCFGTEAFNKIENCQEKVL